jgi:CubicO group peptidase (beta-lactamase class C family)
MVAFLSLHGAAAAQPRPWQPMPRYELRASAVEVAAELERATAAFGPGTPGLAVAILRDGETLGTRYAGLEDLDRRTPIGPATRFYIASLAKTMTAVAALRLRERGALRLEDPVDRWLEGLPPCTRGIRISHLLQHTSGLPDHFAALGDSVKGLDNARVLAFVRGLDSLRFEPGVRHEYSNTGYVLLAEVIARASGRGFAAYLADSILVPLGMTETSLMQKGGPTIEHRATGHRKDGTRHVVDDVRDHWTLGSGGVYSSLRDVVTWYRAVVTGRLLRPSSTALLFETPVTHSGRKSHLGMGWSDETPGPRTPAVEGLRAYGSFGELAGFRAALMFFPDHGLAWIALSNAGAGAHPPDGMLARLFRRVP